MGRCAAYTRFYKCRGGLQVDFAKGTIVLTDSGLAKYYKAHGALMIASFLFLFPVGAMFGILKKGLVGGTLLGKDTWFRMHQLFITLAICTAFAGWVIALAKFDVLDEDKDLSPRVNYTHAVIGLILMSLSFVQIGLGAIRPDKDAPRRPLWYVAIPSPLCVPRSLQALLNT